MHVWLVVVSLIIVLQKERLIAVKMQDSYCSVNNSNNNLARLPQTPQQLRIIKFAIKNWQPWH